MGSRINLKVLVLDTDFYARRALTSYLAWDRRTRVVAVTQDIEGTLEHMRDVALPEKPDVLVMETEICADTRTLTETIRRFRATTEDLIVICLTRVPNAAITETVYQAGARGCMVRNEIRLGLVFGIVFALEHRFVVTPGIMNLPAPAHHTWRGAAELIPSEPDIPEMTERIRQALWLCVIEGMPAQLAADEMGISPHTIRSYIKEGYRILEAHDNSEYPEDMGPIERAFMRFTAINKPDINEHEHKKSSEDDSDEHDSKTLGKP